MVEYDKGVPSDKTPKEIIAEGIESIGGNYDKKDLDGRDGGVMLVEVIPVLNPPSQSYIYLEDGIVTGYALRLDLPNSWLSEEERGEEYGEEMKDCVKSKVPDIDFDKEFLNRWHIPHIHRKDLSMTPTDFIEEMRRIKVAWGECNDRELLELEGLTEVEDVFING